MKRKLFSLLLVIAMISTLLAGCGGDKNATNNTPSNDASKGSDKSIVRMALWSAPAGIFNPVLLGDDYDGAVAGLIYEPLVEMNPKFEFESGLAEKWEISEDSKSITFYLRKDVKWHDGQPFTAEDVKYTFEFISDPGYAGNKFSQISPISGANDYKEGKSDSIKGIEVIDDHTIKITTDEVFAPFLDKIAGIDVIPQHIWSKIEVSKALESTDILRNPVGTGPFKFEKFVPDQYVTVEKNEEYWAGAPKIDSIVLQVVNQDTAQAQMLSGEIDFMQLSSMNPDDLALYEDAGIQIQEVFYTSFQQIGVNIRNPLLADKKVRQALTYAIDRQGIVDSLLHGHGNVANTTYPPFFWSYPGDEAINAYDYSPEKAIEILTKEVGWEYKDGKMYADGKPVKFSLVYPTGNKARELSAPVIQENLKNIGIELDLQIMEFATMLAKVKDEKAFDLFLLGSGIGADPDVRNNFSTEAIETGSNYMGYSNTELDKLFEEGVKYIEIEKRKPIYFEAAKIINEDMPVIFLYNWSEGRAIAPKLKGVQSFAFGSYYKVNEWYIEK